MKLNIEKQTRAATRLDAVLFVVGVLWLLASFLLLALYRPGNTHAVQPGPAHQEQMAGPAYGPHIRQLNIS